MTVRGVILDVDGTLVDSNDAHARSWVAAFREEGLDVPFEKVRPLIGKGGDKLMPEAAGVQKDSRRGKKIEARRRELFVSEELPGIRAFASVRELVERLRAERLALVVASSSDEELLDALLDKTGTAHLLDRRTSSDDVEESKPEPDVVRAALDELKLPPQAAVMIGDTPYDVTSAAAAGVAAIALRCGGWDDESLRGAVAIYDDPRALLAGYESSPLAAASTKGAR